MLLIVALSGAARAGERARSVSELMTDVQRWQGQMARGDAAAYALQRDALKAVAAAISSATPDSWKDKSETDAVAAYILGGGQPREVARLLERGDAPKSEEPLLRGALAYSVGREREASQLLGGIDAAKASLKIGGQLAYAQSVILTAHDPKRAVELLDLARILAPGSLIEEAALRREILLLGDLRDKARIEFLARQYVERFGHSIYAENFIDGLAAATLKFGLADDLPNLAQFTSLLSLTSPEQRRKFLLTIARGQMLRGKFEPAGAAARSALADVAPASTDEARAKFYAAAAQVFVEDNRQGVEALKSIDRAQLERADQALLAATSYLAEHLYDPASKASLAEARREEDGAFAHSPGAAAAREGDEVAATIQLAEASLARANDLDRRTGVSP